MSVLSQIFNHPANQGARLTSLAAMLHWQCYKRVTKRHLDIDYHGLKLRCHPDNHSSSQAIYFSNLPDFWEMRFILDYLKPGDHFIDAGANIGLYTLLAISKVGPLGHVDSFEPKPETANLLRQTIELNKLNNVSVHELGLSDVTGKLAFTLTGDDCTNYISGEETGEETIEIAVTRLDKHLQNQPYAMAKFDIEGYEPFALRGASDWMRENNPPVMLVEMAGYSNRHGVATSDFVEELDSNGYFTAIYCPETRALKKTRRHWEIPVDNVLVIAKDKEEFVIERLSESKQIN